MKQLTTHHRPEIRLGAVLAVSALVALAVWLALRQGAHGAAHPVGTAAVAVSELELRALSTTVGQPIYWVGPESGVTYELTRSAQGIYVRYLPKGVAVGSGAPYLTVATYPVTDAFAATSSAAGAAGTVRVEVGGGAVAFYRRTLSTNIYMAYPGAKVQIEVYSPSAGRARRLVAAGDVTAVGSAGPATTAPTVTGIGPVAVEPAELETLERRLGHPIYWVGPEPRTTYELTRTAAGRVYIRYLPAGVKVGSTALYLTVATYPMPGAFAITRRAASRSGTVRIRVRGGVAFYTPGRPTSVYLSFPGSEEQIEVYDPVGSALHRLVAGDLVRPLP